MVYIAGDGLINFKLSDKFLVKWLNTYKSISTFLKEIPFQLIDKKLIIDYSSPNNTKQMHVGHLLSMNIGNYICRILKFYGVNVVSGNHIGDLGTHFGILIMAVKHGKGDISKLSLEEIESLYKKNIELTKNDDFALTEAGQELVELQNGDDENIKIWEKIKDVSQRSLDEIYKLADVSFDYTLGESFYNEKIDLATVLYITEEFGANEIICVLDGRKQDHFQQLFLTVKKRYYAYGRKCPVFKHENE